MAKKAKKPAAKKAKAKTRAGKKPAKKKTAARKPARKTSTVKAAKKSGKKMAGSAIPAIVDIAAPVIPGGESKSD